MPDIFVLGGPNGAGKTTAAREVLPGFLACLEFVNADEIARGLSAFRPEKAAFAAGRIMLNRLDFLVEQGADFAFESTLASRSFSPWLRARQSEGFGIHLIYFWLSSPELALARVELRVQAGGHSIPEEDVRRRYQRSRRNFFEIYSPVADTWQVYDNSGTKPSLLAFGGKGANKKIVHEELWGQFVGSL
jgi:predicted ABC-type ATPase